MKKQKIKKDLFNIRVTKYDLWRTKCEPLTYKTLLRNVKNWLKEVCR